MFATGRTSGISSLESKFVKLVTVHMSTHSITSVLINVMLPKFIIMLNWLDAVRLSFIEMLGGSGSVSLQKRSVISQT